MFASNPGEENVSCFQRHDLLCTVFAIVHVHDPIEDRELGKAGLDIARIDVTILDAKPNKPTFKQLGDTPGLDYGDSKSIGGMKLSATAFDASGKATGDLTYDWYETDIRYAGISTWQDAKRASDRFARKFVKELTAATPSGS